MELYSLVALVNFATNMSGKFQRRRKQGERHEQSLLQQSVDRELFRARCEEERHQAAESRAHDWELAAQQRQSALDLQENQKVLDHWPLRLFPSLILKTAVASGPVPLRVFISPPKHLMLDLDGPDVLPAAVFVADVALETAANVFAQEHRAFFFLAPFDQGFENGAQIANGDFFRHQALDDLSVFLNRQHPLHFLDVSWIRIW